jgi:hypothetical protein
MNRGVETSAAQWRVLRWFLIVFFTLAAVLAVSTLIGRSRDCTRRCALEPPAARGELHMTGGGRFESHLDCRCVPVDKPTGP